MLSLEMRIFLCVLSCSHLFPQIAAKIAAAVHSVMSDSLHPLDYSMSGFPVLHHLPELAQIHVH